MQYEVLHENQEEFLQNKINLNQSEILVYRESGAQMNLLKTTIDKQSNPEYVIFHGISYLIFKKVHFTLKGKGLFLIKVYL